MFCVLFFVVVLYQFGEVGGVLFWVFVLLVVVQGVDVDYWVVYVGYMFGRVFVQVVLVVVVGIEQGDDV